MRRPADGASPRDSGLPRDGGPSTDGGRPREESRAAAVRRRDRRVYAWSFAVAVVVHALVLFFGPWFRSDPVWRSDTELVAGDPVDLSGLPVALFFGPPAIEVDGGAISQEPSHRVLHARRLVAPPPGCGPGDWSNPPTASGDVRLVVNAEGLVDEVRLTGSTGYRCWDALVMRVAGDLLYHWLPSERFPAPVELHQPITVSLSDR